MSDAKQDARLDASFSVCFFRSFSAFVYHCGFETFQAAEEAKLASKELLKTTTKYKESLEG